jgi:glycerol-3-phosphate dehydrogenase
VAASDCVDLLVIGGGINGTGIARDAAGRGLRVALVEQGDLAAATSSASTKLIHGGLRYLEFFEFRLVRESLSERERLLTIAPHIVRPMQFVLPHVPTLRPRWQIRFGLFFYDHFGGRRRLPASRAVAVDAGDYAGTLQPSLRHGFTYSDCWVDDSRLVVLNAMDAAQRGAAIHTRTRFLSATFEAPVWRVRCAGRSGEEVELQARALVNAAGPWVEDIARALPCSRSDAQVRLVKGSHIVVPRLYRGEHAFLLQNADRRVVFAIPYETDFTLVGTTDVPFEGDPLAAAISREEVDYLCRTINSHFRKQISAHDVRWTYAGVRPLLDDDTADVSRVTRDYRLELTHDSDGRLLLSVFGGKITTYRRLAEQAVDRLMLHLGATHAPWTATAPLPGGDLPQGSFPTFHQGVRKRWNFLPEALALRLARTYGTRIDKVLGAARHMVDLGEDFGAGLTEAEIAYLKKAEWAQEPDDILWRRTKLGLHMTAAQRDRVARAF